MPRRPTRGGLERPGAIAVIEATPANLKLLAGHRADRENVHAGRRVFVFNGLTPEGLTELQQDRGGRAHDPPLQTRAGALSAGPRPLTAGLTTGDVALYSSQRIFPWTEGNYVVSDDSATSSITTRCALRQVAVLCLRQYRQRLRQRRRLAADHQLSDEQGRFALRSSITLPKPQTITEFTWIGNTNYYPQTKVELIFDGDAAHKICYDVQPTGDPQVLPVKPAADSRKITLESPHGRRSRARGRWSASTTSTSRPSARPSSTTGASRCSISAA